MEETKKINHHGHVREVSTNEDGTGGGQSEAKIDNGKDKDAVKAIEIMDYFDFAFQTDLEDKEAKPGPKIAFQEYHSKSETKNNNKLKVMNGCIFFSRKVKPFIIFIFVLVYWGSGLIRSHQLE